MSPSGSQVLDPALLQTLRATGAYAGFVYLTDARARVLRLAVLSGVPRDAVTPWLRIPLDAPVPGADAARSERMIWLPVGQLSRQYPATGTILPYSFALGAAPLMDADRCWGALVLLWSATHPPELDATERDAYVTGCDRIAGLLSEADLRGEDLAAGAEPRPAERPRSRIPTAAQGVAASDFAERLPEGCCALDIEGRIAFLDSTAARLLGIDGRAVHGELLWDVLPWLRSDPVFTDQYRRTLFSRESGPFVLRRPPDRWIRFQLYADSFGISVRLAASSPAHPSEPAAALAPVAENRPAPTGQVYHLMQLAALLTEAASVEDVTNLVAGQIMPAIEAQGLVLFVAEAGRLRIVGHRGYGPELHETFEGQPITPSYSPAAKVLVEGAPAFYNTAEEMAAEFPHMPRLVDKAAWALLPLITSGRTVGCCVLSFTHSHQFSPEERNMLTALAGLIAQALDRARLYDTKHQLARRLQAGLLPRELPRIPGMEVTARYLPATEGIEIGGDFYDLIRLGRGRSGAAHGVTAGATIGDVQGHNVAAAALMGQVRTAVHATAGAPPGEVLRRANRLLTDLDPGLFTSCLYVDLDLPGRRARMATAGHLPPLLRYPDGRVTTLRMPPGPLLGIDTRADYPAKELELPPGSVLLMYTDGLVERPGIDLDESIAELAGAFAEAGSEPLDAVAEALVARAHQADQRSDDIAMLLLRPR